VADGLAATAKRRTVRHDRYFQSRMLICEFASTEDSILFNELMAFSLRRRAARVRCAEEVHFVVEVHFAAEVDFEPRAQGVQREPDGLSERG